MDLVRKADELAGGDHALMSRIAVALRATYDDGLQAAREQCAIEEQDCKSDIEKNRCRNISTACLHMMYEDEDEK